MADGIPKDYSSMYCEDSISNIINIKPPIPFNRSKAQPPTFVSTAAANTTYKSLDGSFVPPKHREQSVDLRQVVAKLQNLPKENHRAYAMDTLNKHYSSVFVNRRKQSQQSHQVERSTGYRAYIQYFDEKDTYVVRVDHNTLRAVRDKLPKQGTYRYFFKHLAENTCEEVELDDSAVPFHEKDGMKQIYCQVFPF